MDIKEMMKSKNLDKPDETRTFEKGRLEIVTVGDTQIARLTVEPGWQWSKHVKPIAGTASCMVPHTQYIISGRLRVKMDDGTEVEMKPGDFGHVPAGHDGWVVGDEPVVAIDILGMPNYAMKKKKK